DGLGPGRDPELAVDRKRLALHREAGDVEAARDLREREVRRHVLQDAEFRGGELPGRGRGFVRTATLPPDRGEGGSERRRISGAGQPALGLMQERAGPE